MALAAAVIAKAQNNDLVAAAKEQQKRKNRQGGDLGKARVMNGEVLAKREWNLFKKEFNHLSPDLFTWQPSKKRPSAKKPVSPVKSQSEFYVAIEPLLRLGPELLAPQQALKPIPFRPKTTRQRKTTVRKKVAT